MKGAAVGAGRPKAVPAKRRRGRRAKAKPPGPSPFYLMLARAEMANVNARAVARAQRGIPLPIDLGALVKQGFVYGGCHKRRARMVPLRDLVHANAEMPERCNACAAV